MIDINRVYQRVLFIANKEQRGYITPEEFNSFADQAQLEVFEGYFLKKFQTSAAPGTTDDYSDIPANVEEKLAFFDNSINIAIKSALGQPGSTTMGFAYPANFYRLGLVTINGRMADEVSHKELTYINLSPLTYPVETQPVFTRHEGGLVVYPSSISSINMIYVRRPSQPIWAHLADPTGEPVYNPTASTDFELHPSDEQDLVYKILTLAGVAIKAQDIAGFGQAKDTQIMQTEG